MRALRGYPVIVTFLYTNCDDTCPAQAQTVRGALDELGEDIPALAVAVDPPRDTPQSARAFLAEQRATGRLDFVLGSRSELRAPTAGGTGGSGSIAARSAATRSIGAQPSERRCRRFATVRNSASWALKSAGPVNWRPGRNEVSK